MPLVLISQGLNFSGPFLRALISQGLTLVLISQGLTGIGLNLCISVCLEVWPFRQYWICLSRNRNGFPFADVLFGLLYQSTVVFTVEIFFFLI